MLIELAAAMTVTAVVLELWLVWRYRWLLELFERNIVLGIAFSMILSWLLGEAFGASGLVILLAAVSSTIVTATVYKTGTLLLFEPLLAMIDR